MLFCQRRSSPIFCCLGYAINYSPLSNFPRETTWFFLNIISLSLLFFFLLCFFINHSIVCLYPSNERNRKAERPPLLFFFLPEWPFPRSSHRLCSVIFHFSDPMSLLKNWLWNSQKMHQNYNITRNQFLKEKYHKLHMGRNLCAFYHHKISSF